MNDYQQFKNNKQFKKQFNRIGSDLTSMLKSQMEGVLDSWAIRLTYHQFKYNLFSVFPTVSKIQNIGMNDNFSTHTKDISYRYKTLLDHSDVTSFQFLKEVTIQPRILRQFLRSSSFANRVLFKFLRFFN